MDAEVRLESSIEVLTAMACELDTRVTRFRAQPFTIELNTGQIFASQAEARKQMAHATLLSPPRLYTPDILANQGIVLESKAEARLAELSDDLSTRKRMLNALGYSFCIVTDMFFRSDDLERNVRHLFQLKHRLRRNAWASKAERVRGVSRQREEWRLADLATVADVEPSVALAVVISGDFTADLRSAPISPETLLVRSDPPSLRILP